MNIIGLPALVGSYDNYIWTLHNDQQAWVVDPGESAPVLNYLRQHNLALQAILITHLHHDHIQGVEALKSVFPNATVYGPHGDNQGLIDRPLQEGERIPLTEGLTFNVLETPGHTAEHIAFYSDSSPQGCLLFCGDTLFAAGCGRKFTGSYAQFADSILKLRALKDDCGFCSAHEYTLTNLKFAYLVEPSNPALLDRIRTTQIQYPAPLTEPQSSLAMEKATNPFLRFDSPAIKSQLLKRGAQDTPESLFATLRLWKDELDQNGALDQMELPS